MESIVSLTCNTSTLAPYEPSSQNPWTAGKIKHVYRRLGYGASKDVVDSALSLSPGQLIDNLVNAASGMAPTPAPSWGYWSKNDFPNYEDQNYQFFMDWQKQTMRDMLADNLRGRLTFFWMNHFVTRFGSYYHSPYAFQYYRTIQTHAVGNFKNFTRDIGLSPAMLIFLDGFYNTKDEPNENFSRELLELFTIGEGNGYTQQDVSEVARACTGYNSWYEPFGAMYFNPSRFDSGQKTIFGQTGNWGYDDVMNILFQERGQQIAKTLCTKLYKYFVSPVVDAFAEQNIIQPLAQDLVAANFELVPVLKRLFKSSHFFDEHAVGAVIKSHFDIVTQFIKEVEGPFDNTILHSLIYYCSVAGQDMYSPPDVAGWPGDEAWINSSTIVARWYLIDEYVSYLNANNLEHNFVNFAKNLTNNSRDPDYITRTIIDHFVPKGLHTPNDYNAATDIFKWEVPQNYYDEGIWSLDSSSAGRQLVLLLKHLGQIPEFQLK